MPYKPVNKIYTLILCIKAYKKHAQHIYGEVIYDESGFDIIITISRVFDIIITISRILKALHRYSLIRFIIKQELGQAFDF